MDTAYPRLFLIIVLCFFFTFNRFSSAKENLADISKQNKESYVAILQMLEAKIRSNYDQISTWSGTYSLKDSSETKSYQTMVNDAENESSFKLKSVNGDFWITHQIMVRFAIDIPNDSLFTTYEKIGTSNLLDRESNKIKQLDLIPFKERHIITSENWIKSNPAPDPESAENLISERGKGVNSAFRVSAQDKDRFLRNSSLIDPRQLFCQSRIPFSETLKQMAEHIRSGETAPVKITETGSNGNTQYTIEVEYRFGGPESKEMPTVVKTIYDEAVGYNVISLVMTSPEGFIQVQKNWEYTQNNGVLIPKKYHYKQYKENSKNLFSERKMILSDSEINEPLDEDTFTWNQLGLAEGDQVKDDIDGTILRYKEGGLIPAEKFKEETANITSPPPASTWYTIVIINLIFLIVVIAIFSIRSYQNRSKA